MEISILSWELSESLFVTFIFVFMGAVVWFIYQHKKIEAQIKTHGVLVDLKDVNIKVGWGDVKVSGAYVFQNKSYQFYKEFDPPKKSRLLEYDVLKADPDVSKISVKIDPAKPQRFAVIVDTA